MLQKKQSSSTKCFNDTACWGWAWSNRCILPGSPDFSIENGIFPISFVVATNRRHLCAVDVKADSSQRELQSATKPPATFIIIMSTYLKGAPVFFDLILYPIGSPYLDHCSLKYQRTRKEKLGWIPHLPQVSVTHLHNLHLFACLIFAVAIVQLDMHIKWIVLHCFCISQNLQFCFNFLHKCALIMKWTHSLSGVTCAGCQNGDRGRRLSFHSLELPSRWWCSDDYDHHHYYFNEYHKLFFTFHVNMYQSAQIMPKLLVWHHFCFYDFGVFFQNIRTLKIFQHLWFMIYDVCEPMKPMPDKRRDPPQMVLFIPQMAERLSLWPQVHISADRDCANKVPPIAL